MRTLSRRTRLMLPIALGAVVISALSVSPRSVAAATPGSGTVDGSAPVSWDFASVGGPSGSTDSYTLTVKLPQPAAQYYAPDVRQGSTHAAVLRIDMTWTGSDQTDALGLTVTDPNGASVGNDTLSTVNDGSDVNTFELQDPIDETYTVSASTAAGNSASAVTPHAVATLQLVDLASQAQPANPAGAAGFSTYRLPLSLMPARAEETDYAGGRFFGEPSIGVDPKTDAVMYQAGLYTLRGTFDDSTSPATASWTDVSFPYADTFSEDAILYTDKNTGRTFLNQLDLACSLAAVSDDDGATWTPGAKTCETPPAVDHETVGGGPFASPLPQGVVYPDATYYCSQNVAESECALSVDGGMNYGNAVPLWTSDQCFGLHGHIKVAPNDGTAYVPNKACGSPECEVVTSTAGPNCHPGFAVSTNNGLSWTVHTINDMNSRLFGNGDPSIGIGSAGTMYFGFNDRDGHPKIAVCTNQGTSCAPSVDVSGPFHIENVEMPTVVAGDDNRAAFAFLGSTTPGDDQENSFVGTWHIYIAMTYDAGKTWTTTDVTPNAPVERGCIEFNANCPSSRGSDDQRNLLDFNDMTTDAEGRVLYAYTDGCQMDGEVDPAGHGSCLTDATRLSGLATEIENPAVARQSCGLGLFAKYDATAVPCAPAVSTPETTLAPLLPVSALGMVAIVGYVRRRRRSGLAV